MGTSCGCRMYALFDYPTVVTLIVRNATVIRKAVDALNGRLLSSAPQPEIEECVRLFGEDMVDEMIKSWGFVEVLKNPTQGAAI